VGDAYNITINCETFLYRVVFEGIIMPLLGAKPRGHIPAKP
jgi:hypothetical protein